MPAFFYTFSYLIIKQEMTYIAVRHYIVATDQTHLARFFDRNLAAEGNVIRR